MIDTIKGLYKGLYCPECETPVALHADCTLACKARLIAIAEEGGYPGGLRAAESAAEDVRDAIQAELRRMG